VRANGGGRISVKSIPGRNRRRHPSDSAERATSERNAIARWLTALRIPIWLTVAAIVVCALGGYLALSRFLAQQLIVTGSILALVYLLMLWVDGFVQGLGDDSTATGRWLKERAGLERQRRERLVLPIGLFLKFAVVVLSVPLILLQWGYRWPDI